MNKIILIIITLFLISSASAIDCWEILDDECEIIFLDECVNGYYSERTDCQRDLALSKIDQRNFLQKGIENYFPNYEPEFIEKMYKWDNISLLAVLISIIILIWMIKGYKVKSRMTR